MRWYSQIFIFVLLFSSFSYSQENKSDSVRHLYLYDHLMNLQNKFEEFDLYRELNYMKIELRTNDDRNTIWMWTKLSISSTRALNFHPGQSPGSMIEPLHQQYIDNSKLNPLRYVLGMAQTAAVGYLAYRHIKKYGLFK
jgi:hypothetical protein